MPSLTSNLQDLGGAMADQVLSSTSTAFNKLPLELNQNIAQFLPTDKDVATFTKICRQTSYATEGDLGSFWRYKYRDAFDMKIETSNVELREQYKKRRKCLRRGETLRFYHGRRDAEEQVIRVLADLVKDSYLSPGETDESGRTISKNQKEIVGFIKNAFDFLEFKRPRNVNDQISPEYAAVQLMCSQFMFDAEMARRPILALDISQKIVYQPAAVAPLFYGPNRTDVNFEWLLHCMNFFRNHLTDEKMATLYAALQGLAAGDRPSWWTGSLDQNAQDLPKNWMGTYAYLPYDELCAIRDPMTNTDDEGDETFIDRNVEPGGNIQTLKFDFRINDNEKYTWPPMFEDHLRTPDDRPAPIAFFGEGEDEDPFWGSGWLNPLPPQPSKCGIPGWKRLTFMKYFVENDLYDLDSDNLWAYEGVILPGGRFILGRWWWVDVSLRTPPHEMNTGPFIFWAVNDPPQCADESASKTVSGN